MLRTWSPVNPCSIEEPICQSCGSGGGGAGALAAGAFGDEPASEESQFAELEAIVISLGFESAEQYFALLKELPVEAADAYCDIVHGLLVDE